MKKFPLFLLLQLRYSADHFFIGTRLWALGKKFGHQTQVSFFRSRWECNHVAAADFARLSQAAWEDTK